MPVRKVKPPKGRTGPCYRYGSTGKVYCGEGAKAQAKRQGRAIEASKNRRRKGK